ncbi:phage protease [Cereibacter sphaeroides]|uniref:phage protease n=1 Tax=Cereibacter sphaeroides TaxID=1063 RepID=UPI000B77D8AF|nr:phage protease [Cereibacter sphaeroides]
MTRTAAHLPPVLMAAMSEPASAAPDWVHLLPAGMIATADHRGPYHLSDAGQVITASFAEADRLPIDENHATDLAAPLGHPAPARGWIVEMQSREDGIWGRVEWTEAGRALVTDRAYRALSPVVLHDKGKTISRILRASLVNRPNLRGLAALNQETTMTLMERLAELLGLDAAATEDQILAAVSAMKEKPDTALQSALSEIGTALGVAADQAAILTAARARAAGADQITALQSELTTVATELKTLKEVGARAAAESFVDGEIRRGRVGVKPLRDHYVAMHMADPARVEKELGALPVLGASGTVAVPPQAQAGEVSLNADQLAAARLIGIDPKAYAETLKAEALTQETF